MLIRFWNWFVKITAWPAQAAILRIKYRYEDRAAQDRSLRGPAIIVSNHTSVYDFASLLFAFYSRTIRVQMAEVLFEKPVLGFFLKMLGGIRIDRNAHSIEGLTRSTEILEKGGVVGVFPEGRLPRAGEERPLPFQSGAAYLALTTGVPVIPVWISGRYFTGDRISVTIGKPIDLRSLVDPDASEADAIAKGSILLREKVKELGGIAEHAA